MADELVEVFHLIAKGNGVGRVLGVRPGGEGSYEAEFLMIWRIGGGDYRLRSAVVGLDVLPSARGQLFKYPPPAALRCEDVELRTLGETLTVAATLVQASQAAHLPGQGTWRIRSEFLENLPSSALRPEMTSLPDPPHWWNAMRKVLVGAGNVAVFAVPRASPGGHLRNSVRGIGTQTWRLAWQSCSGLPSAGLSSFSGSPEVRPSTRLRAAFSGTVMQQGLQPRIPPTLLP